MGLVDEQKGLVYSFPMFQHRGAVHEIKIKGVPGVDVLHMNGGTSNVQMAEIFKDPGWEDSRDRNGGNQPVLRHQERLGINVSVAGRQVVLLEELANGDVDLDTLIGREISVMAAGYGDQLILYSSLG
jgi:hypothetical protein